MVLSEYISNLKIKVYGGNYTSCPSSWAGSNVSLALHKLYFPLEGSALITANGRSWCLHAGEAMLIPKGVTHSFCMTQEKHLVKYWLHFTALSDGSDLFESFHDITVWDFSGRKDIPDKSVLSGRDDLSGRGGLSCSNDLSRMCRHFETLFPHGAPDKEKKEGPDRQKEHSIGSALAHQAALFSIMGILLEHSDSRQLLEPSRHSTKPALLEEYIENHLSEPIRVEDLARLLYMHPTAFIRYFKHHFGMPPLKYIKCLRLERSKHYLETTGLSISEIAELTGFGDASHLSRDFRATYGISPGQARK